MRRIPLVLAFGALFLVQTATAAPDPGTDVLARDTEARWVPFDLTPGNQIRFTVAVDGKPVSAILDTGVNYSVLSRAYVSAAGLRVRAGGRASAIGGGVSVGWVDTRSITLGGLVRTGGSIGVAELPSTATGSARPIEMLVGRDLTARYALDIDYDAKRFRLLPSGRMPFAGQRAPLAISPERLVYVSEMTLDGAALRPMLVDTGDGNAVTLAAASWKAAGGAARKTTSTISFGLGGAIVTDLAIVPQVRVGTVTARQVEIQIEQKGGFSENLGMAGRIGSGFLQRYRVLLDPSAGQMVLKPGSRAALPPERSTSGVLVAAEGDRLRVLHVMRGGPAAEAGFSNGDTICSVDGTGVTPGYAASPLARWSIGTPGRTVTLGLCDGAVRALTLRQFY